jgi:hypothetical protein
MLIRACDKKLTEREKEFRREFLFCWDKGGIILFADINMKNEMCGFHGLKTTEIFNHVSNKKLTKY